MALLPIVEFPDKRLKLASMPVEEIDDKIKKLASDMIETMYAAPGIGLAAIQVGEPVRMLVCDVSREDEESRLMVVINPEISEGEGECAGEEGCLSVPGVFEEVKRYEKIVLDYLDLQGERKHIEAEGMLAICLQHEIDHLNGKLFIDRLSSLKKKLAVRKVERFKKERESVQNSEAEDGSLNR